MLCRSGWGLLFFFKLFKLKSTTNKYNFCFILLKVTIWDNKLQLSLFYTHLFCGVLVSVITMRANQRLQKSIYYFSTKHAIHLEEIARTRWFSQDNVSEWRFLSSCIHSAIKKRGLKRGVASFEVDSLTLF
jgi:hypothetical protein